MKIAMWTRALAFAGLGATLWWALKYGQTQRRECIRLAGNQSALLADLRQYRLRDSLQAASVEVLMLKNAEFERHFAELKQMVREMDIKVKRVESVATAATQTGRQISAPVRDTVIARQPATLIRYTDPFLHLDGIVTGDRFDGSIVSYDTLVQVVHRVPRKFLFFRFGTKCLRQEIVSKNPHSRITYSEYIRLTH
ncbi:MAG: hypothetical protein IJC16_01210 [Rikenellaceae bacterium]|nr:hypothetical protein [Rikenellaceae bacterium]